MLAERGHYEHPEQAHRDLLTDRQQVLGPDHPSTRITQDSLAALEARPRPPNRKPAIKSPLSPRFSRSTGVHRCRSLSGVGLGGRRWMYVNYNSNCE